MFKQSPSRNHRSRSVKVKHVLQFCVLLAVCFWLIYQVKRSHDKKKEFDENNSISLKVHAIDGILKFGRKDLHPQLEETVLKNGNHDEVEAEEDEETGGGREEEEEEEEEESKHEEEDTGGEDEEGKHEEDEQEEDGNPEEKEDESRGGGDDEIDERDQEKSEMELEREEDLLDGEKEGEEDDEKEAENKDSEDSEGQSENESSSEDHDHDESSENDHEAREEHYKADDASSAVTHESQDISTETERESSEKNEYPETEVLELENGGNNTVEVNAGKIAEGAILVENEMDENGIPQNVTDPKVSTINNEISLSNETDTMSVPTEVQNNTEGSLTLEEVNNLKDTVLEQSKRYYVPSNSSLNTRRSISVLNGEVQHESALISNASAEVDDRIESLATQQIVDEAGNEESESSNKMALINQLTEDSGPSKLDTSEGVQLDQIDSSDSSIHPEEHDVRTNLGGLPEIRTEGNSNEDAATE